MADSGFTITDSGSNEIKVWNSPNGLSATQEDEAIKKAHDMPSASEVNSVVSNFTEQVETYRIRLDAGIQANGSYYAFTEGDVMIYQVSEGNTHSVKGQSFGNYRLLYAFYPADGYSSPIELGTLMTDELTDYNIEVTVPSGANYLYVSKADGYSIGLYDSIKLYDKEDKSNTILLNEKSTNLTLKASAGSRYVDNGLNTISFSKGENLYLWQIIKSIELIYPDGFSPYTNSGVLRKLRVNYISKGTDAYVSFAFTASNGFEQWFSGEDYHLPFGLDEKNISGSFVFTVDGFDIVTNVVYDFSDLSFGSNSLDTTSADYKNNRISDRVVTSGLYNVEKLPNVLETNYATMNAFNILEKAPGMIKFGSSDITRTRHASCVFGDMHEDWTPLYNISKIYDLCPEFKDYIFATIGVGDFLIGTRTREENLIVLEELKTAIASHNIPFGACIGGHDFGNDTTDVTNRNRVTHCLTKQDQRDNIIVPAFNTFSEGAVLGTGKADACYWYVDDLDISIRYIFLDECDLPDTLDTDTDFYKYDRYADVAYSQEQLTWLTETALNVNSGWNIVLCTHTADSYKDGVHDIGGTVGAMWECLTAYNDKTTASISLSGEIPISINKDFTTSNGKIICVLWGHTHASANHVTDGINVVNVPNSGFYPSNAGYPLKNAQDRDCAEFLIADTVDNNLRFLRYGRRGVDVISEGIPLEIKPNDTGDRFVDAPLSF